MPLAGIRVLEIGSSVAAPYATWILAMLGAEVVKVERPVVGDDARQWGEQRLEGASLWFHVLNNHKKSIALDLKDDGQRSRLQRYVAVHVDVVLQNLRPGGVEKLGLDAATLLAAAPRLVYCNIGAFGSRGPLARRPGYDPLMQAFGGIMSITGEEGRPPVRVGCSIIDMGTGMWCAIGTLAALYRRELTGKGGVVDTALFETAIAWVTLQAAECLRTGVAQGRYGSGVSGIAPYQAYACSDGYLVVAGANDRLFGKLCEVLGQPEWAADARFESNAARLANRDALNGLLSQSLRGRTRAEWQARLDHAGVPCAPLQSLEEVVAHEQTEALGIIQKLADGSLQIVGLPLRFDGVRPAIDRSAPRLGEHDSEILR